MGRWGLRGFYFHILQNVFQEGFYGVRRTLFQHLNGAADPFPDVEEVEAGEEVKGTKFYHQGPHRLSLKSQGHG